MLSFNGSAKILNAGEKSLVERTSAALDAGMKGGHAFERLYVYHSDEALVWLLVLAFRLTERHNSKIVNLARKQFADEEL